jgi:hypothetical protein
MSTRDAPDVPDYDIRKLESEVEQSHSHGQKRKCQTAHADESDRLQVHTLDNNVRNLLVQDHVIPIVYSAVSDDAESNLNTATFDMDFFNKKHKNDTYKHKSTIENLRSSLIASKQAVSALHAALKISHDLNLANYDIMEKDAATIEFYKTTIHAFKMSVDNDRNAASIVIKSQENFIEMHRKYAKDMKAIINILKVDAENHNAALDEKDKILFDTKEEHLDSLEAIRISINDLRYVSEFGESYSRGTSICPVTRMPLMPLQTVVMLRAECSCNCMVTYEYADRLIQKFKTGEDVSCMTCNRIVYAIKVTTTENAEKLFMWRDVEANTDCDKRKEIYTLRAEKLEQDRKNQEQQDTLKFRQQLDALLAK